MRASLVGQADRGRRSWWGERCTRSSAGGAHAQLCRWGAAAGGFQVRVAAGGGRELLVGGCRAEPLIGESRWCTHSSAAVRGGCWVRARVRWWMQMGNVSLRRQTPRSPSRDTRRDPHEPSPLSQTVDSAATSLELSGLLPGGEAFAVELEALGVAAVTLLAPRIIRPSGLAPAQQRPSVRPVAAELRAA